MARLTDEARSRVLADLRVVFPSGSATKAELKAWAEKTHVPSPRWIWKDQARVLANGFYSLLDVITSVPETSAEDDGPALVAGAGLHSMVDSEVEKGAFVPKKDPTFVPFGCYEDIEKLIASKVFFPVYLTGQSGLGKTASIIEACARLGREMVRVNITKDTDEIDLFGSYELINGNTVRNEGPVLTAMRRGAILLMDETDYGTERILCMQSVLEGKPYLDKKTNTIVYPVAGFNVFATANTKGKGSSDGRFVGANVLNEAFLERFATTEECEYPPEDVETKILQKNFKALGLNDEQEFIEKLVKWSAMIRRNNQAGEMEDVISTRRLVHIARSYAIYRSRKKAITKCLNRFEERSRGAFLDLYKMLDDKFEEARAGSKKAAPTPPANDFPTQGTSAPPVVPPPPVQAPAPSVPRATGGQGGASTSTTRGSDNLPTDGEIRAIKAELGVKTRRQINITKDPTQDRLIVEFDKTPGDRKMIVVAGSALPTSIRDLSDRLLKEIQAQL